VDPKWDAKDVVAKSILLDIHYKYDKVDNMSSLLDVTNKESSFFNKYISHLKII
jgi:hypothetical protein